MTRHYLNKNVPKAITGNDCQVEISINLFYSGAFDRACDPYYVSFFLKF